jgi:DNA-binding response OmpR family regulator
MDAPRTILVVDDDVNSLSGLLELLRDRGYKATGAATLEAATRLLDAFLFDLLIVDLRLGRANGLDLIYRARQEQSMVPAILITGFWDESTKRTARALGTDCVLKPIIPSDLLELVKDRLASAVHVHGSYLA